MLQRNHLIQPVDRAMGKFLDIVPNLPASDIRELQDSLADQEEHIDEVAVTLAEETEYWGLHQMQVVDETWFFEGI